MNVSVMATDGRPRIMRACLERLVAVGLTRARLHYAGALPVLVPPAFDVQVTTRGKPYLPAFWRLLLEVDPSEPLLFLENDVWASRQLLPVASSLKVPPTIGCVSLFDFRNEAKGRRGLLEMPTGRPHYGSQALLFPPHGLDMLQRVARAHVSFDDWNSWDQWAGLAVELVGMRMGLYAPSLVQHLGVESTEVPGNWLRPTARNFPEPWPKISEMASSLDFCPSCGRSCTP